MLLIAPPPGSLVRLAQWGFAAPLAAALVACLLLRQELGSMLAPLLGPWAGRVYGHTECTMAAVAPAFTTALVVLGLSLLAGSLGLRHTAARPALLALWVLWAALWELAALLSVANTLS